MPKAVKWYDDYLRDLLQTHLLVCDPLKRKTLMEAMQHPYFTSHDESELGSESQPQKVERFAYVDLLNREPLYEGNLMKLSGDPEDEEAWKTYKMWITNGGALAYFSKEENRRMILYDAAHLSIFQVGKLDWIVKPCCFELRSKSIDGERTTAHIFRCESYEEYVDWVRKLTSAVNLDLGRSIDLSTSIVKDLSIFKAKLRSQRKADLSGIFGFEVHFKAPLWRVKTGGNMSIADDWILREMWLTRNGSFMYYSNRYEGELMYYTEDDVASATIELILDGAPARAHAFRVCVPPLDDFVFAPDNFAAQSRESLERWLDEFQKFRNSFNF